MAGDPKGGHGNTNAPTPAPAPAPAAAPSWQGAPKGSQTWFAIAILQGLGAPINPKNIAFLIGWMHAEGHGGANNPLNVTTDPNHVATGSMNSVGVKNFATPEDGVASIVYGLGLGHYTQIKQALVSGNPEAAFAAVDEFGVFSGNSNNPAGAQHYVNNIRSGYQNALGDPNAGNNVQIGSTSSAGAAADTQSSVTSQFPGYSYLLNDPEVGPILRSAVANNWSDAELQNSLQGTTWWRTHGASARQWDSLKNTDPASYQQQVTANLHQIQTVAQQLGVTLPDLQHGLALADQMGRFGWTTPDITRTLIDEFGGTAKGGSLTVNSEQVRAAAADWGVNLTDSQAQKYAQQIAESGGDAQSIASQFATQAKAMFPHFAAQFDQGLTLRDVAQPYLQRASALLGGDTTTMSMADPKWSAALAADAKGQQKTMDAWSTQIMSDPRYRYQYSDDARNSAVNLTQQLAQSFALPTG